MATCFSKVSGFERGHSGSGMPMIHCKYPSPEADTSCFAERNIHNQTQQSQQKAHSRPSSAHKAKRPTGPTDLYTSILKPKQTCPRDTLASFALKSVLSPKAMHYHLLRPLPLSCINSHPLRGRRVALTSAGGCDQVLDLAKINGQHKIEEDETNLAHSF